MGIKPVTCCWLSTMSSAAAAVTTIGGKTAVYFGTCRKWNWSATIINLALTPHTLLNVTLGVVDISFLCTVINIGKKHVVVVVVVVVTVTVNKDANRSTIMTGHTQVVCYLTTDWLTRSASYVSVCVCVCVWGAVKQCIYELPDYSSANESVRRTDGRTDWR